MPLFLEQLNFLKVRRLSRCILSFRHHEKRPDQRPSFLYRTHRVDGESTHFLFGVYENLAEGSLEVVPDLLVWIELEAVFGKAA